MNDGERVVEQAIRFSKIWWQSRADARKSQEYMALGLGVSKKTIQNWEKGIAAPNLLQGLKWFELLGLNPLHYYLEFMYPSIFKEDGERDVDESIEKALIDIIKSSSTLEKRQLLFIMSGNHGSSWYALLQLFTAHCHTNMQSRATAARLITDNYEIGKINNNMICPNEVQPDVDALNQAVCLGKSAAMNNNNGYIIPTDDDKN